MLLYNHAVARALIPAVGAGLAGTFTANLLIAGVVFTALSGVTNELINRHEGERSLADNFRKAITELEKELEKAQPKGIISTQQKLALTASLQALTRAEPDQLTQLMATKANRESVAHLIDDQSLLKSTREQAESYLMLALNHWQKHLKADDSVIQALRTLLTQHQQSLETLANSGLDFGANKPYLKDQAPPSWMFRAESSVLSLIGRERELQSLQDWCAHEVDFAITVRTAPGGVGKTRLALELMRNLQNQGWLAALVERHEVLPLLASATLPKNILLVLDYADYRSEDLKTLLNVAKQLNSQSRVLRILLLARPDAGWWEELKLELSGNSDFYSQLISIPPELIALGPAKKPSTTEKQKLLKQVASASQLLLPNDATDFELPNNSTPLMWMMAAYRFLQPNRQPSTSEVTGLCEQMVMVHELKYLEKS